MLNVSLSERDWHFPDGVQIHRNVPRTEKKALVPPRATYWTSAVLVSQPWGFLQCRALCCPALINLLSVLLVHDVVFDVVLFDVVVIAHHCKKKRHLKCSSFRFYLKELVNMSSEEGHSYCSQNGGPYAWPCRHWIAYSVLTTDTSRLWQVFDRSLTGL